MKKLILLISLILVTSLSFSQTVTNQRPIQTDTIVPLTIPTAKLIIKDLLKGDGAQIELVELQKVLQLTNEKMLLKDEVIFTLNSKISNLDYIILQKDEQFKLEREKSESLVKELKAEKRKTFLYKVGTVLGVVAVGYLLVN
jgi:TolA-binding protein